MKSVLALLLREARYPYFQQVSPNLPSLLRAIFVAAGGQQDDWDEFGAVMVRERRLAAVYNPGARANETRQGLSSPTGPKEDERKYQ
jgi:hypothetical protein